MTKPSIFSVVTIFKGEEVLQEYLINYSLRSTKDWIVRTTVWALTNNYTLQMEKATQKDIEERALFVPADTRRESVHV